MEGGQEYKVVLIGESGVGKTSLIQYFNTGRFDAHSSTIGASFYRCKIELAEENAHISVNVWDTAGEERFQSLIPLYLRNVHGVILVYDVSRTDQLEQLENYFVLLRDSVDIGTPILLCGNKKDCIDDEHQQDTFRSWAEDRGLRFIMASAKTGENVPQIFSQIGVMVYRAQQEKVKNKDKKLADLSKGGEAKDNRPCCW